MKNITLSVDEDVVAAVRRHAAEHNSTVNGLVREYLTNLAAHEDRAKHARARLRQLTKESRGRLATLNAPGKHISARKCDLELLDIGIGLHRARQLHGGTT
jgi:hypothetical protein